MDLRHQLSQILQDRHLTLELSGALQSSPESRVENLFEDIWRSVERFRDKSLNHATLENSRAKTGLSNISYYNKRAHRQKK
ncbi:hypothetical protein RSAG8_13481, partial [Rhizoctonia solani AG-8 WAC10335]